MASIRIADTVHPLHATKSNADSVTTGVNDGIYHMRDLSRASSREKRSIGDGIYNLRDLSRTSSRERRSIRFADGDAEDDDPGLRQTGDYKTKQVKANCPRSTLNIMLI
jgi:hypothetical protein